MSTKNRSRKAMALVLSGKKDSPMSSLHRLRSAVDVSEDEDARLTGMTRSLDRRLLALNLSPPPAGHVTYMRVA